MDPTSMLIGQRICVPSHRDLALFWVDSLKMLFLPTFARLLLSPLLHTVWKYIGDWSSRGDLQWITQYCFTSSHFYVEYEQPCMSKVHLFFVSFSSMVELENKLQWDSFGALVRWHRVYIQCYCIQSVVEYLSARQECKNEIFDTIHRSQKR